MFADNKVATVLAFAAMALPSCGPTRAEKYPEISVSQLRAYPELSLGSNLTLSGRVEEKIAVSRQPHGLNVINFQLYRCSAPEDRDITPEFKIVSKEHIPNEATLFRGIWTTPASLSGGPSEKACSQFQLSPGEPVLFLHEFAVVQEGLD